MAPELVVLFYNTVLNKSSNWGVSPFPRFHLDTTIPLVPHLGAPAVILQLSLFPPLRAVARSRVASRTSPRPTPCVSSPSLIQNDSGKLPAVPRRVVGDSFAGRLQGC